MLEKCEKVLLFSNGSDELHISILILLLSLNYEAGILE